MEVRRVVPAEPVVQSSHVVEAEPRVVVQTVQPVAASSRVVRRSWSSFSVSQVLHGLTGLFLVIVGAVTIGKAGFTDIGEHTVQVLGWSTTAVLGLAELFAGLLLMCAALSPEGRVFGGVLGVLLFVGGIVIAAGSNELLSDLHTESGLGWMWLIVGLVALIGGLVPTYIWTKRSSAIVDTW
jgi:hypothetical protein